MAERPDLEYLVPELNRLLSGRTIVALVVRKPVVMRVAVPEGAEKALVGRRFERVERRGHFVRFAFESTSAIEMVVSPMLAGRFLLADAKLKVSADTAAIWTLDDGRELRYRDDVQMGKVYVIPRGELSVVPGLSQIGVDVLDAGRFTLAAFRALARGRREQVRVFLMDKSALDSMGNAYADEVLWEAKLHPKRRVGSLSVEELDRLHAAIVSVLDGARRTLLERKPPLDVKLRDFLKVRGRSGEPCSRCGTRIRTAGVRGFDTDFCPSCQPDVAGTGLVDWRKLPLPSGT
jgi:formamidopyrimidine-DNA glycosylase